MNEWDKQDSVRVNHLNDRLRVKINGELIMLDERTNQTAFREIEREFYNFKYRVRRILDRVK